MPIKIRCWINGDPPAPFKLGPPPTDFGAGRAAYSYNEDGTLNKTIYRGGYWLEFEDGTTLELGTFKQFYSNQVLDLLRLVQKFGLEETPESVEDMRIRQRGKLSQLKNAQQEKARLENLIQTLERDLSGE